MLVGLLLVLFIRESSCFFNILETFIPNLNDDGYLDTMMLATRYGYRCEEHFVTTSDGYILKMHRLNGRIDGPVVSSGSPTVYLQHGFHGSDDNFILDGPNDHGGILSDYGFDVWMGNTRGNRYSKNHTRLNTNSREFWDFSNNEVSLIDMSAFIDYILEKVNKASLHIIGVSQGGGILAMFLAYKPEYNAKVKSMTFLASAVNPGQFQSSFLSSITSLGEKLSKKDFINSFPFEVFTYSSEYVRMSYKLCNRKSLFFSFCLSAMVSYFGEEKNNLDLDRLPYYVAHEANGISSNQVLHIAQVFQNNRFQLFDYGPQKNELKYGSSSPPRANFSLIAPPKLLFYGTEDLLMPENFVLGSLPFMTNVKNVVRVDSYNHYNFLHAFSLKEKVSEIMKEFIISND